MESILADGTNVVVRLLVEDDPWECAQAKPLGDMFPQFRGLFGGDAKAIH